MGQLILSRRLNERIRVRIPAGAARVVDINIVEIRGKQVRLGFVADHQVKINREELDDALQLAQQRQPQQPKPPQST